LPLPVVVSTPFDVVYGPLVAALKDTSPMPPVCWTVPKQLQSPLAVAVHVALANPIDVATLPTWVQSMLVDESTRHDFASVNCSVPEVIVSSEKVPSALPVQVPVTVSEPVTGADVQLRPAVDGSSEPDTARHEDEAFHVPTTLPPQADTFEQDALPLVDVTLPVDVP
jgi:hypothetical protein